MFRLYYSLQLHKIVKRQCSEWATLRQRDRYIMLMYSCNKLALESAEGTTGNYNRPMSDQTVMNLIRAEGLLDARALTHLLLYVDAD